MVREIEYLNARLWGMRGSLLPDESYKALLTASTRSAWITSLRGTPYSKHLGPSIDRHDSRTLYRAIDASIASRTHRLTHIVSGKPAEAVKVCLAELDLQNLIAITSGIHYHASPMEILSGTLAGGFLTSQQLEVLAHCGTKRDAADLLSTWGYAYHPVYRRSIGHLPDKPLTDVRLDLNRCFMETLLADARRCGYPVILRFIMEKVDRINLMTALMWRALPLDRDPVEFYLPGGVSVNRRRFVKMLAAKDIDQVLSCIGPGLFKQNVQKVAQLYNDGGRISLFETSIEWEIIHQYSRPLNMDPLGAELLLSYLLRLRREGIRLKQSLTRLLFDIPIDAFMEMTGRV